jgi:beta-glucosidase
VRQKATARLVLIALVVGLFAALPAAVPVVDEGRAAPSVPIYLDTSYSFAERAADLVSRMTLAEKAVQMNSSQAAANAALGLPAYGWWNEALHGVSREQLTNNANATTLTNTTSYPINLSVASSWDPGLTYREASMISDEAREVVRSNTLDLDFYSPTINLARDPRWGRNDESYGEDPFLTTAIASQFVNGMEGKDMGGNVLPAGNGYLKTITTLKHYAANNNESTRRTGTADMDDRTLREYYTAQFRGIVEQAHPGSIMSSYNRVNGVPTAASVYLMDNLARQTFGFSGYFTSDCDAIYEIQAGHHWQPPGYPHQLNNVERHAFAMSAGEDLDCQQGYHDASNYGNQVPTAVGQGITTQTGLYTENDVDTSLQRLFTARMQLGEFEPNNVPWVTQARTRVPQGTWMNNETNMAVTETPERLAMAREVAAKSIVLLKNDTKTRKDGSIGKLLPLQVPASGLFRVAVIGYLSNPSTMYLGGYSSSQGASGMAKSVNGYNGIKAAIQAINPSALVDYYCGFVVCTGASGLTTVDPVAVNASATYDAVIVYVGTDGSTAAEDTDRSAITLPGAQASLISQVAAQNPNTIVYMETIGEVTVTAFEPAVAAILWSSYNGQRKGEALADVLLGTYNPSGRLPFIWHQSVSQLPAITNYAIRPNGTTPGRTYMYFNGPVSYPFGYGLSYSTFAYSNLRIDDTSLDANNTFGVAVDVSNTSAVPGSEVVELYVNTPDAPAALERPIRRLRGFEKVSLGVGETKTVTFSVKVSDLAFWDEALGRKVVDNGRYGIQISRSSADADIELQDFIEVTGALNPVPNVLTVKPTMQGDGAQDIPTRVRFPGGVVVVPNITVAMSDDTLYGYIKKNGSQPFPAGMTFQYSSNRPGVVSVDGNGVIRTVAAGVATVTATVTYGGVSKSAGFVLVVTSTPTAVTVESFEARRDDRGVLLSWRTASEAGLLGFNVFRRAGGGPLRKVNRTLIAAKHSTGASYGLPDRGARRRAYAYRLQLVGRNGARRWSATATLPALGQSHSSSTTPIRSAARPSARRR